MGLRLEAYVDGSFDSKTGVYGGGVVVLIDGVPKPFMYKQSGNNPEAAQMANISGELLAAVSAIEIAMQLNAESIKIYHDYVGIANWVKQPNEEGFWKAKKPLTRTYAGLVRDARNSGLKIFFEHVRAHTGVEYNELADRLAMEAVRECTTSSAIS